MQKFSFVIWYLHHNVCLYNLLRMRLDIVQSRDDTVLRICKDSCRKLENNQVHMCYFHKLRRKSWWFFCCMINKKKSSNMHWSLKFDMLPKKLLRLYLLHYCLFFKISIIIRSTTSRSPSLQRFPL